jgi:hypothetical protein
MSKPRNIVKVIEAIKKELEKHNYGDGILIVELNDVARMSGFRAPEVMAQSWGELTKVLEDRKVSPKTEPGITIARIMRDEIDVGARDE